MRIEWLLHAFWLITIRRVERWHFQKCTISRFWDTDVGITSENPEFRTNSECLVAANRQTNWMLFTHIWTKFDTLNRMRPIAEPYVEPSSSYQNPDSPRKIVDREKFQIMWIWICLHYLDSSRYAESDTGTTDFVHPAVLEIHHLFCEIQIIRIASQQLIDMQIK